MSWPGEVMDPGYSIEEREGVMVIRLKRSLSKQEIFSVIDVIAESGSPAKRLWYLGNHVRLTPEDMSDIGAYGRDRISGPGRVAYVADDDVTFGLTNIQAAYRNAGGFEDQLFRDEQSALAWLLGDISDSGDD